MEKVLVTVTLIYDKEENKFDDYYKAKAFHDIYGQIENTLGNSDFQVHHEQFDEEEEVEQEVTS